MKILFFIIFLGSQLLYNFCNAADPSERAQQLLDQHFHQSITLRLLSGGYSYASNFYLEVEGKEYVLRIYPENFPEIEVLREFYALEKSGELGVAPLTFNLFLEEKAILMKYLQGTTVTIKQAKEAENYEKIADSLRQVHSLAQNPYQGPDLMTKMEGLYTFLVPKFQDIDLLAQAIEIIREAYCEQASFNMPKTLNHGDLQPRNIFIQDDLVRFIDWTDTCSEDPFFDLTFFVIEHGLSPQEEKNFLKFYLQRSPTDKEWTRFSLWKKINWARICLLCHFIIHQLQSQFEQTIDPTTPLKDWQYYIESYAQNGSNLSAQLFHEAARLSLYQARG